MEKIFDAFFEAKCALLQEREVHLAESFQEREMLWVVEKRVLQEREMELAQTLQNREMQWAKEKHVLQEKGMQLADYLQDREKQLAEEKLGQQEREDAWKQKFEEQKKASHERQLEFARAAQEWSAREQLLLQLLKKRENPELFFNIDESSSGLIPEPEITQVTGEDQTEVTQLELGMPAESVQSGDNFYHCIVTVKVGNSPQEGLNDPSVTEGDITEPQTPPDTQSTPPNSNKTKNMITEQEKPAAEETDVVQDTQGHPVETQDTTNDVQVKVDNTALLQMIKDLSISSATAVDSASETQVLQVQYTTTEGQGVLIIGDVINEVQVQKEATESSLAEPKGKITEPVVQDENPNTSKQKRKRRKRQADKQAAAVTDTNKSLRENQDTAKTTQVEQEHTAILQTKDQDNCSTLTASESQTHTAKDKDGITEVQGALDMDDRSTETPPETPATIVQVNEVHSSWEATKHCSSEPIKKPEAEVEATSTALVQTENQSDCSTVPADNPSDAQAETPEVQDTIIQHQDVLKMEEKATEIVPEPPAASLTEPQTNPEAPLAAKSDCAMDDKLTSKVVETSTDPSEVERQKVSKAALAETSSNNIEKRKRRINRAQKQAAEVSDEQEFSAEFQSVTNDTQVVEDNTALLQSDGQADCSNTATTESQTKSPTDEDVITEDQSTAILPETPAALLTVVDKTEPASESQTVAQKAEDTIDEDQGLFIMEDQNQEVQLPWEVAEHSSSEPLEITVAEVADAARFQIDEQDHSCGTFANAASESQEVPIVQDSIAEGECVLNMDDVMNEVQNCNEASGESTESISAKLKKTMEDETPCPDKRKQKRRRKQANQEAVDNEESTAGPQDTAKGATFEEDGTAMLHSDVQGESQTEAPKAEDAIDEDQDVIHMEDQTTEILPETPSNSTKKDKKKKRQNKQGDFKALNVDFTSAESELLNDPKSRPRKDYDYSIPAEGKVATKTYAKAQRQDNKQNAKAERRKGRRQGDFEFAQESDDNDFTYQSTNKRGRRKKH